MRASGAGQMTTKSPGGASTARFSASAQYKPEPLKRYKARKVRTKAQLRAMCRVAMFLRAEGRCEDCGKPLVFRPQDARHESEIANVHEIKPRSLGGNPLDPDNCRCLCSDCHRKEHRR